MNNASQNLIFDSKLRALRDKRAARIGKADADFLAKIAADTIAERLYAVNRNFHNCADILSRFDAMHDALKATSEPPEIMRIGGYSQSGNTQDWSPEDGALPLEPESQDLITSVFGLHRVNDPASMLTQVRFALKPDGLFMAALPGAQTLKELRQSLIEAETELVGGAAMRVDPFGTLQQYGELLQQCGFALPVIDHEVLTIRYGSLPELIRDLRAMGSTLISGANQSALKKSVFLRATEIYRDKYADPDGRIRATFECVYLSGWAPHSSQQKPLQPGSAKASLADVLSKREL